MMQGIREFLNTKAGQAVSIVVIVIALGIAFYQIKGTFGQSSIANAVSDRMFVDSTTGKPFEHEISIGDKVPVAAPSGGNTGYPGEPCYWTKDGKTKSDPTWVLLNDYVGKSGPTFCPDCSRLVVAHNPAPGAGVELPPTETEYKAQKH